MNPAASTPGLRELLAALPAPTPDQELILRPDDAGGIATATVRTVGATPRVFAATADGVQELTAPTDAKLPGAALLRDRALLDATLSPLLGTVDNVQLVAWRPGRRAVLAVTTPLGRFWLKLLETKSFARATQAFDAVGEALLPLRLALPRFRIPAFAAHVVDDAKGRSLRTLVAANADRPTTHLVRSVLALAYTTVRGELPRHGYRCASKAAVRALMQGALLHPKLLQLASAVARIAPPPAPQQLGFVHGDLHDKQLFVDHDTTTVIDLEGIAHGDTRFDVVNLAEHLRLRDLQQIGDDRGHADQLLTRCALNPDDPEVVAFRIAVRARLCGVYALRPRWTTLVDRLRHETTTLLERLL